MTQVSPISMALEPDLWEWTTQNPNYDSCHGGEDGKPDQLAMSPTQGLSGGCGLRRMLVSWMRDQGSPESRVSRGLGQVFTKVSLESFLESHMAQFSSVLQATCPDTAQRSLFPGLWSQAYGNTPHRPQPRVRAQV